MKSEVRLRWAVLILGLLLSQVFNAQNAVLQGRIYSRLSFENISHANVVLRNNEGMVVTSLTTGLDGRYQTDTLEPGTYKIEVYAREFESEVIDIVFLQPGKTARIDISMSSKNSTEEMVFNETNETSEGEAETETENKPEKKFKLFEILGDIMKTSAIAAF